MCKAPPTKWSLHISFSQQAAPSIHLPIFTIQRNSVHLQVLPTSQSIDLWCTSARSILFAKLIIEPRSRTPCANHSNYYNRFLFLHPFKWFHSALQKEAQPFQISSSATCFRRESNEMTNQTWQWHQHHHRHHRPRTKFISYAKTKIISTTKKTQSHESERDAHTCHLSRSNIWPLIFPISSQFH